MSHFVRSVLVEKFNKAADKSRNFGAASALRDYEAARVPFGMGVVQHARHLGAFYQAEQHTPEERKSAERYRDPDAVIRDTAIPFNL